MLIYFIVFAISIYYMRKAYIADIADEGGTYRYLFLSAVILILLAACRGDRVGWDILGTASRGGGYQKGLFLGALASDSFIDYLRWSYEEPIYSVITYLAAKCGHMFFVHLFNMMIIIIPIYIILWDVRHDYDPAYSLAVFLFVYYGQGYNIVRQAMAISIVMLSVWMFSKEKYLWSAVLFAVAIGIHYSAVVGLITIILYYVSISRFRNIYRILMVVALITGTFFFRQIMQVFLRLLPFVKSNYFSRRALFSTDGDISATSLILSIISLIMIVTLSEWNTGSFLNRTFLLYIMIILFLSIPIGGQMGYARRAFRYFDRYFMFTLPLLFKFIPNDDGNQTLGKIMFYGMLMLYWIAFYFFVGSQGIVPYYPFWGE